jgi:tryptophan-rich sensory protein
MNSQEWTSLLTYLGIWWVTEFAYIGAEQGFDVYKKYKTRIIPKPPAWVLGLIWNILLIFAGVVGFLLNNWVDDSQSLYDAILGIYLANLFVTKMWRPIFFHLQWLWLSFWLAILIALTSIAALIIMWIETDNNGVSLYVAASLYIPYALWTIYFAALNTDVTLSNGSHPIFGWTKKDTQMFGKALATGSHLSQNKMEMGMIIRRRKNVVAQGAERRIMPPVKRNGFI